MPNPIHTHLADADAILQALDTAGQPRSFPPLAGLKSYQHALLERFGKVIGQLSFTYISKTPDSWLVVGDQRNTVAASIQLIAEHHGVGVAMLVLHLQQLVAGHIPRQIHLEGVDLDLTQPTQALPGARGEQVLWIPVRGLRGNADRLAALNILKPARLLDPARTVSHEPDGTRCFFCSCAEMNPAEVVLELDAHRFGLSRSWSLGFTFAPFGHPVHGVHFLAWDRSAQPLSMSLTPSTVPDLVQLTRLINQSIQTFFQGTGIDDFPVLDGLSNGWAGNTIFHAHYQFYAPEFELPLEVAGLRGGQELFRRDDTEVTRLEWGLPAYRIQTSDPLNTALMGQELAALWRFLGGDRRVPYKTLPPDRAPQAHDLIPAHTQNLYVPGRHGGRVLHLVLRDRARVDYLPDPGTWVNAAAGRRAQPKRNLGVLEATGTWIVDEANVFAELTGWPAADLTGQIGLMLAAAAPEATQVAAFEQRALDGLPR